MSKKPKGMKRPTSLSRLQGTQAEINLAYDLSREYYVKMIKYCSRDKELTKEELDFQRRYFHFVKSGPNKNYFTVFPRGKLTSADVMMILSTKTSKSNMSKMYGVSEGTIQRIREGKSKEWRFEYNVIRALRTAVTSKYKGSVVKSRVVVLTDGDTKEVIAVISSRLKAKEYRREYLRYKRNYTFVDIDKLIDCGKIEELFPIKEYEVILD